MTDKPIAFTAEGRPIFDNTPTVVAVIIHTPTGIIAIRRGHNPGLGLLGLPGGYHMRGETWQQAGAREALEETGYRINPEELVLASLETDEYGNNLVIAEYDSDYELTDEALDGEALEVLEISRLGPPAEWAFPKHYDAAKVHLWHPL